MYFLSVCPMIEEQETLLAILRKFQKNVRKHYEILEFRRIPAPGDSKDALDEIAGLYDAPDLKIRKKIYSQDLRPVRRVVAPPKIVYDFTQTGPGPVDRLREKDIAVEGLSLNSGAGWRKDPHGRALGNNFHVSEESLVRAFQTVWEQKRLHVSEKCRPAEEMQRFLGACREDAADRGPLVMERIPAITAVALPIWFRETIRYSRPYRA